MSDEASALADQAVARLDEAAKVEADRLKPNCTCCAQASGAEIAASDRIAARLRDEARVYAAAALVSWPGLPQTVPCKACFGRGTADSAARAYHGIYVCQGCHGAGVHVLSP